ncbi:MAG: DUF2971 domain-containing protein [Pseudomonadota bacterium]
MRLYKFTGRAEFALSAIERKRLKLGTIDDLNDPFEFRAYHLKNRSERAEFEKHRKSFGEKAGIISFSATWRNPLLWGHYGDNHRGICLGFDVPENAALKVNYVSERLSASPNYVDMGKLRFPVELAATKFDHWGYEEEYRLVSWLGAKDPVTGLFFAPFQKDLKLQEVIFGAQCKVPLDDIEALVGSSSDIKITTARLGFRRFEVTEQKLARLQQKRRPTSKPK